MQTSDILITGAAGFIGSNLAMRLVQKGYVVTGVDNLSYGSLSNLDEIINHKNFSFFEKDIADQAALNDVKAGTIVHLASQKIPRYSNSLITLEENNKMLQVILQKCLYDQSKLVFASTSDVYGKNPTVPYHETSDFVIGHSGIKRWAYSVSKIYSEHLIMAYSAEYGMDYSIFRLFGCYGPRQNLTWWGGPQSGFITSALNDEALEIHGDGKQTRSFLYVDDAINGISSVIESKNAVGQVLNLSSKPSDEIGILDLGKKIWNIIRSDAPKYRFIPYSSFGSYEDVMRRTGDYSKANQLLGYEPEISLDDGLKRTIEWQRNLVKT